jgi:predicted Fe-Mo cluster-binding NifX family protein
MKVAIPELNNKIAPCFEAAKQFYIAIINNSKITHSETVKCYSGEGFMNIRILRLHKVHTLICNGIKSFYKDQLRAMGIQVIPNVNDSIQKSIDRFIKDELPCITGLNYNKCCSNAVLHDELVIWAKDLFESNGYSIALSPGIESFLIDLVAIIKCPVCSKQIDVAICCGAQIYRTDQEIREFHHNTKTHYKSRVYVNLTNPQLEKSCNDYGIDFISPEIPRTEPKERTKSLIPILRRPVEGHEKAFNLEV